jgi:hypothetical protein
VTRITYIVGAFIGGLILLIGGYSLSSNQNISVDAISGTYQIADTSTVSQLQLNKDGTYTHEFRKDKIIPKLCTPETVLEMGAADAPVRPNDVRLQVIENTGQSVHRILCTEV